MRRRRAPLIIFSAVVDAIEQWGRRRLSFHLAYGQQKAMFVCRICNVVHVSALRVCVCVRARSFVLLHVLDRDQ